MIQTDKYMLFFDIIEMSIGVLMGSFLILLNRRTNSSKIYLGLFLLTIGLSCLTSILVGLFDCENFIKLLPLSFTWSIPAFLYVFVIKASILKPHKNLFLIFIPGILEILFGIVLCLLPQESKIWFENSFVPKLIEIAGLIFALILVAFMLLKIKKNDQELHNQLSSVENKELSWVRHFLIFLFFLFITFPIILYLYTNIANASKNSLLIFYSIIELLMVVWVSYKGLKQKEPQNIYVSDMHENAENKYLEEQVVISTEQDENLKVITDKIDALLDQEKLFLQTELSVAEIAFKINEHPRLISKAINIIKNTNFNTYINSYRVEYALTLLQSDEFDQNNIEAIGKKAGFNSNSTFYSMFKKMYGTTPHKYLKERNNASRIPIKSEV